jgi:DNA-binding beta-propeller fold protein YncE
MGQQLSTAITSWLAIHNATAGTNLLPTCQTTAPTQITLTNVTTAQLVVPEPPFGLVYALEGDIAFAALNDTLGILNTTSPTPSLLHQIPLPANYLKGSTGAAGVALTHNGGHVLVTLGTGAIIVDVAKAINGSSSAIIGAVNGTAGDSAIEVVVTPDGSSAFVSQEYGNPATRFRGSVESFNLSQPSTNGSISSNYIGFLGLGSAVVGMALSPNGSTLYATSEGSGLVNGTGGNLSVIDVAKMKTSPTTALLSSVAASCGPVRALVSSDGKTVWVTARESNHLLAFDAAKLISKPHDALLTSVQVGTSPVGLIFAKNQSRILTADSNRFNYTNTTSGISVVDIRAALSGQSAVLGRIPTGIFPREFAISPDNKTILVSDYGSKVIMAIDVATLP